MSNQHDGFGKVHEKMYASSIMRTPLETRWVFVHLFSCCGADGKYAGDSFAISRYANVPEDAVIRALEELASDDPQSSSREFKGRRIEDVSEGKTGSLWLVLNYKKYRARRSPSDVATYNANYYKEKVKPKRDAKREKASRIQSKSNGVKPIHAIAEAESEERAATPSAPPPPALSEVISLWETERLKGKPEVFHAYVGAHPGWAGQDWRAVARLWSAREREEAASEPLAEKWGANRPPDADSYAGRAAEPQSDETEPLDDPPSENQTPDSD